MKYALIGVVAVVLIAGGYYFFSKERVEEVVVEQEAPALPIAEERQEEMANEEEETEEVREDESVLGTSREGRPIVAYHFGEGEREVLFVGGIHGGYSWNTALVAYELVDYLTENESALPNGVRVTVVPVMNPDGLARVVGTGGRFTASDVPAGANTTPGRYNAAQVDLNRNFDCEWQPQGVWRTQTVSGGDAPFSEPEALALKQYVETNRPAAAVVWYSAAGGVYSSNCLNGVLPETRALTNLYAQASGYSAHEEFDFYEITGDMVNWMAKENIPAISVLLTDHQNTEWQRNWRGISAVLERYAQ